MVKKALQDFLLPATPALHRPVSNTVLHVNGSVRCTGIMQSSLNNTDMFNAELCLISQYRNIMRMETDETLIRLHTYSFREKTCIYHLFRVFIDKLAQFVL